MRGELLWLTATVLMTSLFWVSYVLNRIVVRGLSGTLANPSVDHAPHADWGERAMKAHQNAVENLVLFVPLVLAVHLLNLGSTATVIACAIYFFARLAHFIVYTLGIPVVRTLTFALGWTVQVYLALVVLQIV